MDAVQPFCGVLCWMEAVQPRINMGRSMSWSNTVKLNGVAKKEVSWMEAVQPRRSMLKLSYICP